MNLNQSFPNKLVFRHISLLAIAVVITLATTLAQTVTVYSKSDQYAVPCGFPLAFVEIDQSHLDPPYPWPAKCRFVGATYHFEYFLLDAVFFYSLLLGSIGAVAFARTKVRSDSLTFHDSWHDALAKASKLAGILLACGVLLIAIVIAIIVFSDPPVVGTESVQRSDVLIAPVEARQ